MNVVRCPLREAAEISGSRPALVREGLVLTYKDYDTLVSAVAARLRRGGVCEGDRVGIFLQADWSYPVLIFSLLRVGAVACPLDVRLPRSPLRAALDHIDCRTMIGHTRDGLAETTVAGIRILSPQSLLDVTEGDAVTELSPPVDMDRPATIIFTSGSSGRSKAVVHSYANHYYSAKGSNLNIRVRSGNHWLLSLPLWHVSGLGILFRCAMGGGAVVLPGRDESLSDAIESYDVTHLSVVPTQLKRILHEDDEAFKSFAGLAAVLVGGGVVATELVADARARGLPIYTSYGLTEMASQVTTTSASTPPAEHASSGRVLKHRELMVGDDDEIWVKGRTLFMGYTEGQQLDTPLTAEGWFRTGDLGRLDEEGYLHVTGRRDNMFVSGGENIYSEEIERVLLSASDVEEAIVVPVPCPEFGQRPVAFLRMRNGGALPSESLQSHLDAQLAHFKHPAAFYPWPEAKGNEGLKADRRLLHEKAIALWQDS